MGPSRGERRGCHAAVRSIEDQVPRRGISRNRGYDQGMAELRCETAFPALPRLLLLAALLGGVVAMHAITFSLGSGHGGHPSSVDAAQHHVVAGGHGEPPGGDPRGCDDCGEHSGLHGCVFVITALAIAIGLKLLYWIGTDRAVAVASTIGAFYRSGQRAPPWTVFTPCELSILRV